MSADLLIKCRWKEAVAEYRALSGFLGHEWGCSCQVSVPSELFTNFSWEGLESRYRVLSESTVGLNLAELCVGALDHSQERLKPVHGPLQG